MNIPTVLQSEEAAYLLGKISAVELLAASLAATLSPAISDAILSQCAALRGQAAQGVAHERFVQGFLSVEDAILATIKQAADAEKIRQLSPGATPQ